MSRERWVEGAVSDCQSAGIRFWAIAIQQVCGEDEEVTPEKDQAIELSI